MQIMTHKLEEPLDNLIASARTSTARKVSNGPPMSSSACGDAWAAGQYDGITIPPIPWKRVFEWRAANIQAAKDSAADRLYCHHLSRAIFRAWAQLIGPPPLVDSSSDDDDDNDDDEDDESTDTDDSHDDDYMDYLHRLRATMQQQPHSSSHRSTNNSSSASSSQTPLHRTCQYIYLETAITPPSGFTPSASHQNGKWYRTSSQKVPASGLDACDSLEMPPMGCPLEDEDVPVFMPTVDQNQNQWSACHFLADAEKGLGIVCFAPGDKYHRSWRDWQWATSHAEGRHDWTSIQLNYVFNMNYQPVGVGGHYGKRAEMNLEFGQLFPRAGPDFESLVQNISLDTRQPPPHGTRRSPRAVQDAIG